MKHLLLTLFSLIVSTSLLAYDAEIDGICYNFSGDEAEVTDNRVTGKYNTPAPDYSGVIEIPCSVSYEGKTYSVTSISMYSFYRCDALVSINIPESVNYIYGGAFSGCTGLTSVICKSQVPTHCVRGAFDGVDKGKCILYVPQGSEDAYRTAEEWKDFENIVAFENDGVFLSQGTAWIDGFGYEQDGLYKIDDVKLFYNTTAGDTLINNKSYFRIRRAKICKTHCELDVDEGGNEFYRDMRIDTHNSNLQFFLREDDAGDVWFYAEDKDVFKDISHNTLYGNIEDMSESLTKRDLFLYNIKKKYSMGDSMLLGVIAFDSPNGFKENGDYWDICPYEIKETDGIVLLDGKIHKRYNKYFMEGVGPLDGPLVGIGTPNSLNADFNQLFAFYKGGLIIYRNEGYLSALEKYFPNILDIVTGDKPNNIGDVSYSKSNKLNAIYDLHGRKVIGAEANSSLFTLHSSLKKGVYIQNGKKVAVK